MIDVEALERELVEWAEGRRSHTNEFMTVTPDSERRVEVLAAVAAADAAEVQRLSVALTALRRRESDPAERVAASLEAMVTMLREERDADDHAARDRAVRTAVERLLAPGVLEGCVLTPEALGAVADVRSAAAVPTRTGSLDELWESWRRYDEDRSPDDLASSARDVLRAHGYGMPS